MANNKKITKKDYFYILRNAYPKDASNYSDVINFIDHEIDLLEKKNSGTKKPTAQQTANLAVKNAILAGMEKNRLYSISEIQKEIPNCADVTNQRISALLRQMIEDGLVVRTEDKRKAFFSLA